MNEIKISYWVIDHSYEDLMACVMPHVVREFDSYGEAEYYIMEEMAKEENSYQTEYYTIERRYMVEH